MECFLPEEHFDIVGIDLLQLPSSLHSFSYVFVCVDNINHFVISIPLREKSVTLVAHALFSL